MDEDFLNQVKKMSYLELHDILVMLNLPKAAASLIDDVNDLSLHVPNMKDLSNSPAGINGNQASTFMMPVSTAPGIVSLQDDDEMQKWLGIYDNIVGDNMHEAAEAFPTHNQFQPQPHGGINPAGNQPSTSNAHPLSPATNVASPAPDGWINPAGNPASTSNAHPVSPATNVASPAPDGGINPAGNQATTSNAHPVSPATNVASPAPDGGINLAGNPASTSNAHPISPAPNAASRRPSSRKLIRRQANIGAGRPNQPPQPVNPGTAPQQTLAEVLEPGRREIRRLLHENPQLRILRMPHNRENFLRMYHPPPYDHRTQLLNLQPRMKVSRPATGSLLNFGIPRSNLDPSGNQASASNAHPVSPAPNPVVETGNPHQISAIQPNAHPAPDPNQQLEAVNRTSLENMPYARGMLSPIIRPRILFDLPHAMIVLRPEMGSLLIHFRKPPTNLDPAIKPMPNFHQFSLRPEMSSFSYCMKQVNLRQHSYAVSRAFKSPIWYLFEEMYHFISKPSGTRNANSKH